VKCVLGLNLGEEKKIGHSAQKQSLETGNLVKFKPGISDWREIWQECYWKCCEGA
jgi:hypothetical protein